VRKLLIIFCFSCFRGKNTPQLSGSLFMRTYCSLSKTCIETFALLGIVCLRNFRDVKYTQKRRLESSGWVGDIVNIGKILTFLFRFRGRCLFTPRLQMRLIADVALFSCTMAWTSVWIFVAPMIFLAGKSKSTSHKSAWVDVPDHDSPNGNPRHSALLRI
jgi:hypothetical protein